MVLKGTLCEITAISSRERNTMFELMSMYYENYKYGNFLSDLEEKNNALLFYNEEEELCGFTTIKAYDLSVDGSMVRLVYSGDTIIQREYWGSLELPRKWIQSVYSLILDSTVKNYWLLISKGYKTYRFLPVYFKEFYPCPETEIPTFEKKVMDTFCTMKFGSHYDPIAGVLHMAGERDYLKEGVAEITPARLKNEYIRFFVNKNPRHTEGEELVCITSLEKENFKPQVLKYLQGLV